MGDPTLDLNETIAAAVKARVEAEMMKALSGDETIASFVTAALQQNVQYELNYRKVTEPYLTHVLRKTIQDATKAAVVALIAEEAPAIEAEIRKALKRETSSIAQALTRSLVDTAGKGYGFNVNLELRSGS